MTINQRILDLRTHLGLRQSAFAELVGVSRSFLSQVESGKYQPSIQLISGVAKQFPQADMRWLLTGDGEMFATQPPPAPRVESNLERELRELQMIASQGVQPLAWRVLTSLNDAPLGMTQLELSNATQVQQQVDLEAVLLLLRRHGSIVLENNTYRLARQDIHLKARELTDVDAAFQQGVRFLLETVLPRAERGEATTKMVQVELRVNDPVEWSHMLRKTVMQLLMDHNRPSGELVKLLIASTAVDSTER